MTAPDVVRAKPLVGHEVRRDFRELAPKFAAALAQGLNEARWAGLDAVVVEALRTPERQAWLYAQGRTRPGDIVTNAPDVLHSWHGYGLGVDVISRTKGWDVPGWWWTEMAGHMKATGLLKWGGDWASFRDLPHVQWGACKASPSDRARELYAAGGIPAVWTAVGAA